MLTNLSENNKKINFTGLNEVAKRTVRTFHPSPEELTALRQNYAKKEIFFRQGNVGDCYLIASLKSIIFGLNEYADKTNKQSYNARNWLRKLVVKGNNGDTEVFLPVLKKLKTKITVNKENLTYFSGALGNEKINFIEYGYGILKKWTDELAKNALSSSESLSCGGISSLAVKDLTGLKTGALYIEDFKNEKELFNKHAGKLFKQFQKSPESLILTVSTKENVPEFLTRCHSYSIKRVIDNGIILVDPNRTNKEININFDDFYKHFDYVGFARLRPGKMFKMIEETKKATENAPVLKIAVEPNFKPVRDSSKYNINKGHVFVEDHFD